MCGSVTLRYYRELRLIGNMARNLGGLVGRDLIVFRIEHQQTKCIRAAADREIRFRLRSNTAYFDAR